MESKICGKDWGRNLIWSYCGWVVALRELPQPGEKGRTCPYLNANEAARGIMDYFHGVKLPSHLRKLVQTMIGFSLK